MGRLKKGGIPDQMVAARIVLNDWNSGKIKYYTYPPEECRNGTDDSNVVMEEAEIVSEFAKEFNLDDLNIVRMEADDIENLPNVLQSQTMVISTSGIVKEHKNDDMSETNEDTVDGGLGKENLLSKQISIGGNTGTHLHEKQVSYEFL